MNSNLTFISAGAGSGKTYRLTQILYEQLNAGLVSPAGVIATTFTKKAATELRERVRSDLLKRRRFDLASAMGQAQIGTVNSVCGAMLERFAFEAGLSSRQQVLEESQASALVKQAIDEVLQAEEITQFLKITHRLSFDNEQWQESLKDLLNKARSNGISPEVLQQLARKNAQELLQYFPKATKQDLAADLLTAIRTAIPTLKQAIETKPLKNTAAYLNLISGFERSLIEESFTWSEWVKLAKEGPEAGLRAVGESVSDVAKRVTEHSLLQSDITYYLEQIFSLCAKALDIYDRRKRELGVVDFTDQESLLLKVLDNEYVAQTLKAELDLLLVDEFQDTSPIQLALFLKLASFAKAVYWVGDIKQAIYGFRGSDTDLMEAILNALPSLGGAKEVLDSSWRSRKPLVDIVNATFTSAFENSLPAGEVTLKAQRPEILSETSFANWMLGGKNKNSEIGALGSGIKRLLASGYEIEDKELKQARPARLGDIAILCRSGDGVSAVAKGLRELGLATATAQPGLLKTPEAVLALACLRRLNDRSDTIATAEIVSLADCQNPEEWVVHRLRYLAEGNKADVWMEEGATLHPLIAKLSTMRDSLPLFSPSEALQSVITQCELPSVVLRWTQDESVARIRLANLEALLELALKYEDVCHSAQHAASVSGLILWLNEQQSEGQDSLANPAIDAIKVMTHHGAKGLEWPVVILMNLEVPIRDRVWSITVYSENEISADDPLKDRSIRYWPWPFGLQQNVALADTIALTPLAQQLKQSAVDESKRLLYVSMTRARDLMIFARSSRKPSGEWLDCVNSHWLLPEGEEENLTLPSGEIILAQRWDLATAELEDEITRDPQSIYWFKPGAKSLGDRERLPLVFNPSFAISPACAVLEKVQIGERINLANQVDMALLGTAVHACIAASFTDQGAPLEVSEVESILLGMEVADSIAAKDVLAQIQALREWFALRWGDATIHAELPVESKIPSGQILNGRIDLLIELKEGWILIDHKSNPQSADHWDQLAKDHAGQLLAYKEAIELASQKSVLESWLFFPVSAGAVRLNL